MTTDALAAIRERALFEKWFRDPQNFACGCCNCMEDAFEAWQAGRASKIEELFPTKEAIDSHQVEFAEHIWETTCQGSITKEVRGQFPSLGRVTRDYWIAWVKKHMLGKLK